MIPIHKIQELAPIPTLSKGHCAVFIDNATLMVIGGNVGIAQYSNATFILNINATQLNESYWSSGPDITIARKDSIVYLILNFIQFCQDWTQIGVKFTKLDLWTPYRAYHTCNVITNSTREQQVVVVGGVNSGTSAYTNTVEIYNVQSGMWSNGNQVMSLNYFCCNV